MRLTLLVLLILSLFVPSAAFSQPDDGGGEGAEGELPPITKNPKLKTFVKAGYPEKAVTDEVEASVMMEIDIDAEGFVEEVRVITPADPPGYGFDEAATDAVFQFEFEPAETAEGPIPVTITYRYNFVLAAEKPEDPPEDPDKVVDPEDPGPETPVKDPVANVTGEALERGTRLPLVGVIVTIFRENEEGEVEGYEASTDDDGKFTFFDIPPGDWKLLIQPEGYYPFREQETVVEGELLEITCFVEKGAYSEFDVLVEGARARKEVARRVIKAEEIDKIPGTFGDPVKVVQNLPGVARTQFGSGDIIVRGSSPEDTKVYIDGIEVPILYHFGGLRSVVPLGIVDQIDFVPGNFSTFYGRATGGVLDVKLKELAPENINGYIDINLFDSGAYLEAPIGGGLSVAIGARRSYIDAVLTAVVPESAPVNLIAAPVYYDYQFLLDYRLNKEHRFRYFLYGSDDELKLLFENPAALSTQLQGGEFSVGTSFIRSTFSHIWTPTDDFTNVAQISHGDQNLGFSVGDQFFLNISPYTATFRDTMTWRVSDEFTWVMGLDAVWNLTDVDIRIPIAGPPKEGEDREGPPDFSDTTRITVNDQRQRDFGAFFELELQAFDDLLIIPGARVDFFEVLGDFTFDPRITARYQVNEDWAVKGGVGIFSQIPTPDETSPNFGNPDLEAEFAYHYSGGVEWQPLPYLTIDVVGFYKDLQNLVASGIAEDPEAPRFVNDAEGRVFGAELLIRHEFANNFFGWITYTLSRSERIDPGETEYRLFDNDQTHILTLIGSYQLPYNWEISGRWRFVSGNPDTPIIGGIFNSDLDTYDPIFGPTNSDRLEPFHQLDLRVDKRWIYDTWKLAIYLDIQNVYNRSNVEGFQYNFDFSERQTQQGLPVLPVLGIKGDF